MFTKNGNILVNNGRCINCTQPYSVKILKGELTNECK